jgi:hypothetical protein
VHHAAPVRRGQPQQRALQDDQRRLGRRLALPGQDVAERDPVEEFHHDRRPGLAQNLASGPGSPA